MADSLFGALVLITGPEAYIAEQQLAEVLSEARAEHPQATLNVVEAAALTQGQLLEMTGSALLAVESVAVITSADLLPSDLVDTLVGLAKDLPPETLLVVVHPAGARGKNVLDKLKPLATRVIDCPALKPWEMARFAADRARRLGARLDGEAAQQLVDAVGSEARAIAAAVEQLAADSSAATLSAAHVRRYFAGRAEVSSFAVADEVLAGNHGGAVEKLRWALSTGVAPVLVTSALAGSFRSLGKYFDARADRRPEPAIAKDVGVPPWKLKDLARQARSWSPSAVGAAIKAVARADADVKGAAVDAEFALERLLTELRDCLESSKAS
ncbi:MAG TPA: DNA polymerase III subunit delta [Propionibacteriaceae bacterium]|nr:DNA polymerase III subunit delta [Propionibacteriaceae bacterium]